MPRRRSRDDMHALVAARRHDLADRPRGQAEAVASAPSVASAGVAAARSAVKPMPQLNVRHISSRATLPSRCSQSNTGGSVHVRAVEREAEAVGHHADDVFLQAAAGDVRHAVHRLLPAAAPGSA